MNKWITFVTTHDTRVLVNADQVLVVEQYTTNVSRLILKGGVGGHTQLVRGGFEEVRSRLIVLAASCAGEE